MIRRRFAIALGSLAALTLVGIVLVSSASATNSPSNAEVYGLALRGILARPAGAEVATVNGRSVTERDVAIETAVRQNGRQPTQREIVINSLALRIALLDEAEKRGISASPTDLAAFVAEQKRAADTDMERQFYRYAEALGYDESTIWDAPVTKQVYRDVVTLGALKRSLAPDSSVQEREAVWTSFVEGVRSRMQVVAR